MIPRNPYRGGPGGIIPHGGMGVQGEGRSPSPWSHSPPSAASTAALQRALGEAVARR